MLQGFGDNGCFTGGPALGRMIVSILEVPPGFLIIT